ncbi:MAG: class I SAM-dependent methyltransferase [Actinomycetaceae bacterium]|nr:class I SAM-dependent methyltransferase [Actinomycetaceae bacterium]
MHEIELLTSTEGQSLLASLPPYDADTILPLTAQLRAAGHAPELIAAALTQSRLRARAKEKFGEFAEQMLFTADGLEQATRLRVGAIHAQRFVRAGAKRVIDFGCGIGADALAFAASGLEVRAIERDATTAAAARHNLLPFPEAEVIHGDGFAIDLASLSADAIWIDPARRAGGKRVANPDKWFPPLITAVELAQQFPAAGIKLAPGIDYAYLPAESHVQWISAGGDLLEAVLWLGQAAPQPGRSALIISGNATYSYDAGASDPSQHPDLVSPRELGKYVFEPDPAIIRSGAIEAVCREFELAPVSDGLAYLTGDKPISSPFLTGFAVDAVHRIEAKAVGKHLRATGVGRVEIKKRGTDLDPAAFRKKLKLDSKLPGAAVLLASPLLGKHRIIQAHRVNDRQK